MTGLIAMAGLALASWLLRSAFILFIPVQRLPRAVPEALEHLAPAALAALVAVELRSAVGGGSLAQAGLVLTTALAVAVVARRWGSVLMAAVTGLAGVVALDLVLPLA